MELWEASLAEDESKGITPKLKFEAIITFRYILKCCGNILLRNKLTLETLAKEPDQR